jgi:sugar lactone lactonase YvrE
MKIIHIAIFCLSLFLKFSLFSQNIYRFAGTGFLGGTPDGSLANGNPIGNPYGMCADNSGNIYFNEGGGGIRKINTSGILSTIAGSTGTYNVLGDGGPATSAWFNNADGIAVDAAGNFYIADQMNNRIRKINTSGIITTIAGTGTAGISGDGGPAVLAQISYPVGITVDLSGNIYFTESLHRVRKIDASGIISTIAGNGTAGYSGDGGPAVSAQISNPIGITIDPSGNIYFTESLARVRKINASGIISTLTSTLVRNIVCDAAGNIYGTSKDIIKIDPLGIITTVAGTGTPGYSGDGGLATAAQVGGVYGITLDANNNVYFGQQGPGVFNQCIRIVCQNNCLAGINESSKTENVIKIYPNPVCNILHLSGEKNFEPTTQIEITNALGQVVLKSLFKSEIDVSQLSNGYYILKIINSNNQQFHSKFIKE